MHWDQSTRNGTDYLVILLYYTDYNNCIMKISKTCLPLTYTYYGTGAALSERISALLIDAEIDITQIDFVVTDKASYNTGLISGAIKLIWGDSSPIWIWCSAHALNWVFDDTFKVLQDWETTELRLRKISKYLNKKWARLKALHKIFSNIYKITRLKSVQFLRKLDG